ncbi:MAG: HD domain-containing protein [Bacteroidales bacterium]|nr:HD domain-containing protein [Bacteroidales bacterium]
MDFEGASGYILHRLEHELDTRLVYHSYSHTIDVFHSASRLSLHENIAEEDQRLVETAALYHDAGMLNDYKNHEESSAIMAADILKTFQYSSNQIETVCDLIRQTKLPQAASSQLAEIICDADLDYLGSDDFFMNSFRLKLEWQLFGINTYSLSEWFLLQEEFLTKHTFLTRSAREFRNAGKSANLESILALNQQLKIK